MPTDLADHTAATTAGYRRVQIDRGAGKSPRFISRYEKPVTGAATGGGLLTAEAGSDVDQATADTNALIVLNAQRRHRYGGAPGRASGTADSPDSRGGSHTVDVT